MKGLAWHLVIIPYVESKSLVTGNVYQTKMLDDLWWVPSYRVLQVTSIAGLTKGHNVYLY